MGTVQFVCVRGAHHRRGSRAVVLCEHFGCDAYCPAGDIGGHEWMPTSTDLATLVRLGYVHGSDEDTASEEEHAREPVLIGR